LPGCRLASSGLPFEFDTFSVEGRVASTEGLQQGVTGPNPIPIDRSGAGPRMNASPLVLGVMSCPPAP